MEKITKLFDVYDFDELDEKIKNKMIEEEQRHQYEIYLNDMLYQDLECEAKRLVEKYFGKNNNVDLGYLFYSFSYNQNEGGGFEFSGYYNKKYFEVKHRSNFYCHHSTFKIENDYDLTDKEREKLKNKVYKMFKEFERIGGGFVKYTPEKEICVEYLRGQKYLKNGDVFY